MSDRRELGRTGLRVTAVCVGTASLGGTSYTYGYPVSAEQGEATVEAALAGPYNFIDTSNAYGRGASEACIGTVLRRHGGVPEATVLATKVDADPVTRDFSGERVRRSVAESLQRLGLDRVQLMYLHDPEFFLTVPEALADDGPVAALVALRDEGVLEHLGLAAGDVPMMRELLRSGAFEVVLNHNRYTLLDRGAEPLIEQAQQLGVGYVNAAPYGGGILAKGLSHEHRYGYQPAGATIVDAVAGMQRLCGDHQVPLAAAALQFSLRDPRVTSTVVGMSDPARITETTALATHPIPDELWPQLEALLPAPEHWLR
ncbi:MAG TPA: aldo/keto reductase [Micromonosporaceae bacterium]